MEFMELRHGLSDQESWSSMGMNGKVCSVTAVMYAVVLSDIFGEY